MTYECLLIDQNILSNTIKNRHSPIAVSVYQIAKGYGFAIQNNLKFDLTPLGLLDFLGINFKYINTPKAWEKIKKSVSKIKEPEIFWYTIQNESLKILNDNILITEDEFKKRIQNHKNNYKSNESINTLNYIEEKFVNKNTVNCIIKSLMFEISICSLEYHRNLNKDIMTYLLQWMNDQLLKMTGIPMTRLAFIIFKKTEEIAQSNNSLSKEKFSELKKIINSVTRSKNAPYKLCGDTYDVDIIHCSIFGFQYPSGSAKKTIIFTGDGPKVVKKRIEAYLYMLEFLNSVLVLNNSISIFNYSVMGTITCLNKETGVVLEIIELSEYFKQI